MQDQAARSQDFLVPTESSFYKTAEYAEDKNISGIILEGQGGELTRHLQVNDVAFDQIATRAGIDVRTARRLQASYPEQWDGLVNAIWQNEPVTRMIRTHMDDERFGIARAFVSDKFKTFDNVHLIETVLPELMESEAQWKIKNADITEKKGFMPDLSLRPFWAKVQMLGI